MVEVKMKFTKETKNTYRFDAEAVGAPPAITTLYVAKWAFTARAYRPAAIVVKVEVVDEPK